MELQSELLEEIVFNTRPRTEEQMLVVMDKSTHEEHLSQPLQTNNEQFKKAVTFLTGYNGIFNITNSNNKFYSKKSITNADDFIQITIPPCAYKIESLNNEIKRIIIDEEYFTESDYPFHTKPIFSTLGYIIEILPPGPRISFVFDDSIGSLLGFHETILYKEYNLSPNPVDILSFDIFFLECDVYQGLIFRGKRSGIKFNWTMTVDPGYKCVEEIHGGVNWYMMQTKDFISSFSFKLKMKILK